MAVKAKEVILLVWKSHTYFGQLQACVWFVSYLATLIGMEILHSRDNHLTCNYTETEQLSVKCPENPTLRIQSSFTRIYGGGSLAIWFLYTVYIVPRLWRFRRRKDTTPLCGLYLAYCLQLFAKLLFNAVMLFIYIFYAHHWFPVGLHCVLQSKADPDLHMAGNITGTVICTDKFRVEKSVMQTTLLLVVAVLALFSLVEFAYILHLIRSRSRTVFIGDEGQRLEHLDNGCWCECVMPTDRQFSLFRLHLSEIRQEPPCEPVNVLQKYFGDMKHVYLKKTKYIDDSYLDNTEALELDSIFIRPIVSEVRRPKSTVRNTSVQKKSENCDELSNILITGRPGMGKTTFAQTIVRKWAKGDSLLSGLTKIVLWLDFNVLGDTTRTVSLEELVCNQLPDLPDEVLDFVKSNPNSILIVVDNVCESHSECEEADFGNSFEEKMPLSALLKKVVTGKLLTGATVLTLSRSTHNNSFDLSGFRSRTDIVGFSPQEIKEYVKKYFANDVYEEDELVTLMLVESLTDNTLSICCVPLHCFYLCSFMKWCQNSHSASGLSVQENIPETITELYAGIVQMISQPSPSTLANSMETQSLPLHSSQENSTDTSSSSKGTVTTDNQVSTYSALRHIEVKSLSRPQCAPLHSFVGIHTEVCFLAMRSIDEEKATFTGEELRSVISDEVISIYFKPISLPKDCVETHFTFRCDYLQEFLAAYFVVSDPQLKRFENLVEQVKDDNSYKRDRVLQFACGLLFNESQASVKKKKEAIHLVTQLYSVSQPGKMRQKELQLVMIKCVAEVKHGKLSREVASTMIPVVEFSCCDVGVAECSALANVLGTSPFASIKRLDLSDNKISVMGARQLTQKLLLPGKGPTEELNVKENMLGDEGLEKLTEALKKKECRLKILNVADNDITSTGVSKLAAALESNVCLEELNLSCNDICSQGVAQLSAILRKEKSKISRLNLSWNNLGDDGVACLASVRQSSLNLAWNNIGIKGVRSLISIFQTLQNLEELDLSGNVIEAGGLEALLPCLMVPGCIMKCLELNHCKLEDEGVNHCIKVLTFSQNQITCLGLAGNSITNDGVGKIAKALSSPECKVRRLNLSCNVIGDEGVESLSLSMSNQNCALQELDLSQNEIRSQGCKHLAGAIRKHNCLEKLNLQGNQVSDEGAAQLLSALRIHNCKLHSLMLDANDIGDEGIAALPHAFRSPHCKLGHLNLGRNLISRNSLETLSEALKSPFCQLEQLVLKDSPLSESFEAKQGTIATKLT
ncbi:hypothetical protein ACROYT_G037432 [Oculina patagonica]